MIEGYDHVYIEENHVEDISIWKNIANKISGNDYRAFIASVVKRLGYGGQSFAESVLGWNRVTIRKSLREQEQGRFIDFRKGRSGRKKATDLLPDLEESIRSIVEPESQTDPTFKSTRIYTTLTAKEVRRRLNADFGFKKKELPCRKTISTLMNKLGYVIRQVQKSKPIRDVERSSTIHIPW